VTGPDETGPADPAATRHRELCAQIEDASDRYYRDGTSPLADAEYDAMLRELQLLEEQFPELITPDSPTQRVMGKAFTDFASYDHLRRMESLDNAFSARRADRLARPLVRDAGTTPALLCELKVDGLAINLLYETAGWSGR
jgi:DNA ligase (NAD+)